jgi:hypothetical protein
MADRDYRRDEDARERYRVMSEMEDNRDRRVRDTFRNTGYGDQGPGGLGRVNPSQHRGGRYMDDRSEWRGGPPPGFGRDDGRHAQGYGREFRDEGRGPQQSDHRGRGPRGYKRSDQRIQEDVNDRLTDDPHLDATEIQVEVTAGEVTLTGNVGNRADRRRAEDIADSVSGVRYVMNNLRVRQHGTTGATG